MTFFEQGPDFSDKKPVDLKDLPPEVFVDLKISAHNKNFKKPIPVMLIAFTTIILIILAILVTKIILGIKN